MDRVFSIGEFSDQFWSPTLPAELVDGSSNLNRSASEWALERFLQEQSVSVRTHNQTAHISPPISAPAPCSSSSAAGKNDDVVVEIDDNDTLSPPLKTKQDQGQTQMNYLPTLTPVHVAFCDNEPPPDIPKDSQAYQDFLKSKLNLACVAVAMTRGPFIKSQESTAFADSGSQASSSSQMGSQATFKGSGCDPLRSSDRDIKGPFGFLSLPSMHKKSGTAARTSSGSSRELSDDDEAEGETELTENMDPADVKRVRRMLSNRESARRSRRRKQAHLTELETQVAQLKVENSSLLRRLTDVSHKYSEAAVENRVLKADVETLRAKVKMAEETVKRITGLNPMLHDMSEMSMGIRSFDGSSSDSGDAAVPVQDDKNGGFYPDTSGNPTSSLNVSVNSGLANIPSAETLQHNTSIAVAGNKMGRTASLQRVASLEHLQKRIRGGATAT